MGCVHWNTSYRFTHTSTVASRSFHNPKGIFAYNENLLNFISLLLGWRLKEASAVQYSLRHVTITFAKPWCILTTSWTPTQDVCSRKYLLHLHLFLNLIPTFGSVHTVRRVSHFYFRNFKRKLHIAPKKSPCVALKNLGIYCVFVLRMYWVAATSNHRLPRTKESTLLVSGFFVLQWFHDFILYTSLQLRPHCFDPKTILWNLQIEPSQHLDHHLTVHLMNQDQRSWNTITPNSHSAAFFGTKIQAALRSCVQRHQTFLQNPFGWYFTQSTRHRRMSD